jgi:hypothetical protein
MSIKPPPIKDNTIDKSNRFVQTWVRWFESVKLEFNTFVDLVTAAFLVINGRLDELESILGWAYYQDSQYTSASPLNINSTTTQITINGLGASTNTAFLPAGVSFFNTTTSEITPESVGDTFVLRFDFKLKSSSNNANFDVLVDIGSASPSFSQTFTVTKGINTEQRYGVVIHLYCLNTFLANGGQIKMATTNSINFYDMGLLISRIHKG